MSMPQCLDPLDFFLIHTYMHSASRGIYKQEAHVRALTLCLRTNLAIGKSSGSCTYTLFLPQGVAVELILALWAPVSEIRANFKIAIFGHETWQVAKVSEVAHISSF